MNDDISIGWLESLEYATALEHYKTAYQAVGQGVYIPPFHDTAFYRQGRDNYRRRVNGRGPKD